MVTVRRILTYVFQDEDQAVKHFKQRYVKIMQMYPNGNLIVEEVHTACAPVAQMVVDDQTRMKRREDESNSEAQTSA